MNILYLDLVSGISGDMLFAALVHSGVPIEKIKNELDKLPLKGYKIDIKSVFRNGISACKLDVIIDTEAGHTHSHHHHDHKETISHNHNHSHSSKNNHNIDNNKNEEGTGHKNDYHHDTGHRDYKSIKELIDKSDIAEGAKRRAQKIFFHLAEAEAKAHNVDIEKVHFHEVGAVDSIVDIVGVSIALDIANIEKLYTNAVRLGSGSIKSQHGIINVPSPATSFLLQGYPVINTDINSELTTPTGAAFIKSLSLGILPEKTYTWEKIGYGAGTREMPGLPNMLRIFIGKEANTDIQPDINNYLDDEVLEIECNIDDSTPEILAYTMEKLLNAGANDVFISPIIMKKSRQAHLLTVLAEEQDRQKMLDIIFSQTSTLGLRISKKYRKCLRRQFEEIDTEWGMLKVKTFVWNNKKNIIPEYEECKRIADKYKIPLASIYRYINSLNR